MIARLAASVLLLCAASAAAQPAGNAPVDPYRIADDVYYVGASDIASYFIDTGEGAILIDAGYAETVPIIQANVRKLGRQMSDIKILLNTQAHLDHAGGLARIKALTGAALMISDADAALAERGGRGDYLFGDRLTFPVVKVDRRLKDGDEVRLGRAVLTAHVTPGHTKGCTTWTFDARDRGRVYHVVVVGGLTINQGTKVSGMATYPDITRDFRRTFAIMKSLPCDIVLGAHRGYYDGAAKAERLRRAAEGPNPFVDPAGYRALVERSEQQFEAQLARERAETRGRVSRLSARPTYRLAGGTMPFIRKYSTIWP
jgi:metallo-beta-lactamase class B